MGSTSWKAEFRRGQILREAQRLARSGQHADHTTIIPLLRDLEGFEAARARLEDRAVRFQLDRLCAMRRSGRERPVEAPPHASTRT